MTKGIIVLSFFCFFAAFRSHGYSFPESQISPLLHDQALSHLAFHSNPFKLALASIFSPRTIAVVGVEWGQDVVLFAEHDYRVFAFEPVSKFVKHLTSVIQRNPHWNVTLVPIAAGNSSKGTTELRYENEDIVETVNVGRVDHHVKEPLGVYSLDIQGDELHVLEGSTALLTSPNPPASLWIEAFACNPKVTSIFDMLKEEYVFFDFVPWGKRKEDVSRDVPRSRESFTFDPSRPSDFDAYLKWMCKLQNRHYRWLQTDFLVVRKDLLTDDIVSKLSSLADTQCREDMSVTCRLRHLLKEKEGERKGEL